jgi:hypothetical protein
MNTAGNKHQEHIRKILRKLIRFCGRVGHWTLEFSLPPHLRTTCLLQHCTWFHCKDNVVVYLWDYPRCAWNFSVVRTFYACSAPTDHALNRLWRHLLLGLYTKRNRVSFSLNQISCVFSKPAHRTQHGINRDVTNCLATFIGAQGGSSQWQPLS